MSKFFGRMRYNKQLLTVFILAMIEVCFVVTVVIFDIVQLLIVKNNAAALAPAFVPLNISLVVLLGISLLAVITMLVIKSIKGRNDESKEN